MIMEEYIQIDRMQLVPTTHEDQVLLEQTQALDQEQFKTDL